MGSRVKRLAGKLVTGLAVGCGCLLSVTAAGRPSEKMDLPDWSRTPVEDRDLGQGVHMLESFGGNIGVLAGEEGVLLVDAEWSQLHGKVLAAVARISPQPVRYLVNTHWHWDHVGGDGLFGKAGVVIFSSEETRQYIVQAQTKKSPPGTPYTPDPAAIPVVTVTNGVKFHLNGQTVEIIHAPPAHTNGDLIVRFVEADVIQTGDTFFHGFYPDIDQPHGGTIDGMIALYDTLYNMCGPNTKIIPGHGPVARREDVREYQAMLREVRNRVVKAIASGMTEEALVASHPLDDLDVKWGGNLIKQPYLLGIVYEELKDRQSAAR
ncbi:MAG: fold metallo-hydrolase [Gammaproteobacteria bacterium]|nr:fold metallo-hydrolase [Gammaproteobacteria bacterium]